ncbi:MAG TPA: hypothetical protein VK667_04650, partial [Ktedonobacteraceae bacterium]|nr:hypothetical protein [Ktedonobacteraceae bacterium]
MINSPERETPVEEMMGWASDVEDSQASLTNELLTIEAALDNGKLELENVEYARSHIQELNGHLQLLDE